MLTVRARLIALSSCLALLAACGEEEGPLEMDPGFVLGDASLPGLPSPDGSVWTPVGDAGSFPWPTVDASSGLADAGLDVDGALSPDASVGAPDGSVQQPGGGFVRGPAPTVDSASKKGPYNVKSITMGYKDGAGFADATLYWPTDATPPFASVAVVPGFVSAQSSIQNWGPFLASHGIVAMTIGTNLPTDQPDVRARALLDALDSIRAENTRDTSELKGKLDVSRQAVMGWSMGGGGALLAAEETPSLKAVVSLAGWNLVLGATYSYSKLTVPALLLAAQGDGLAGAQSQPFYDSIPASTPKELWEAPGETLFFTGHDTFNDPNNLNGTVGRYGLSWLKLFLEGDSRYREFLLVKPDRATDFRTNLN